MKKETAKAKTPPAAKSGGSGSDRFDETTYQRNLFITMTLTMTWQLAVAVIVPVLGGYYLDKYFKLSPALTIIGVVVAALGVIGVLIRIMREANRRVGANKKEDKK